MNIYDSGKLAEVLAGQGYQEANDIRGSDIILVNTCCVRENAENRAFGFISSLKNFKKQNPGLKIGICGCIVKEEHIDLKNKFPFIDWFIPPNSPDKLIEHLNSSFIIRNSSLGWRRGGEVVIMHGCNNFCSYCVVPYVRGREVSRPMDEVLEEIGQLIEQGAKKIMLLGQNVNSYKYGLADLLSKIGSCGLEVQRSNVQISFMTSHPRDISDELIQTVYELPYVAKEFHLPLQSGDNEVLKMMNRGYTVEYYREIIRRIRALMPQAGITTDLIVGFPGETEEQFQNTLAAVKEIRFNAVNMAAYSLRPQTAAARLPRHLSEEEKHKRLQSLIEVVRKVVI